MGHRRWIVVGAIAIAVAAAGACRTRRPTRAVVEVPDEPARLPHDLHAAKGLLCADCHAEGVRPGANDHAPCDRGQCHDAAFQTAPGPVCEVCHATVDVTGGDKGLRPYPLDGGMQAMPSKFAHARHLDPVRLERAVGFNLACIDCHTQRDDRDAPAAPGHVQCARCHAPEVGLDDAPAMTDCDRCHVPTERVARHARRLITGDLHFDHRNHVRDARGALISCRDCHEGAVGSKLRTDQVPPSVRDCVGCHDDPERVPDQMRMRMCETCHANRIQGIGSLAPRDHLPGTERPVDHTIAFRFDHAEQARRDAARCGTCHTQLSGSVVDTCDECHQVMRPHDHTVTWRELDHGGFALSDSERCATCHVVDYCSDCHRLRPRSHLGGERFAMLEHGDLARVNPRSCMTCHDPVRDCSASGCHTIGFSP
jgi:hypothetical protein